MYKEIKINPQVLSTLIKTSGYDIEDIYLKLKISTKRIEEGKLTLTQVKKLSEILKRPLIAFFNDEVPIQKVLPDYRLNREKKINPEVLLAQRKLEYLIAKLKDLGNEKSVIPSFPLDESPTELAKEFRNFLGVSLVKKIKSEELLNKYKEILEEKLNLIIIEYPLKPKRKRSKELSNDVRAFSIYDELSGIVLNESDHPSVKLFSLFHEVCHLLRKSSGICSLEYEVEKDFKEESYCNQFSAEFLVPFGDLIKEIEPYLPVQAGSFDYMEELTNTLSKIYGVSKHVILLRLLNLGYILFQEFDDFKKYLESKENKPKYVKRKWIRVFKNRIGNVVLKRTKSSLIKNEISFYEALKILDIKAKYAEKLLYEQGETA
jgi:Zn-dependent peptidase ImmA (M78 family)